jgi:protein phosphatase
MQAVHLANGWSMTQPARIRATRHGSTLAVVMQDDDAVLVLNVGDSRVLRSTNGNLEQITVDHRFQDDPRFRGVIDPGSHHHDPDGNTLTRAMGGESPGRSRPVPPETGRRRHLFAVQRRPVRHVPEPMIARVLAMGSDLERKSKDLIDLALAGGGKDNVTPSCRSPAPSGLKKLLSKITGTS